MKVVDAHFHLFETDRFRYAWLAEDGVEEIPRPFDLNDYLALAAASDIEVEAAVHVDAEQDRDVDQTLVTGHLQALHDEPPGLPTAAVIWADLASDRVTDELQAQLRHPLVRGIRQHVFHPPSGEYYPTQAARSGLMQDDKWRQGFARLPDRGLSFDLFFWPNQLQEAVDLMNTFPEVSIIFEHALMPAVWPSFEAWRAAIGQLPVRENTFMKLSAFGQMGNVSMASVAPYVRVALDHFGPERCMFASNFPVDSMGASWSTLWQTYAESVADLNNDEKEMVFRTTARRAYRI